MKNTNKFIGFIALAAIIVFTMTGCPKPDPEPDPGVTPPESKPDKDRWGYFQADDATATLSYSVDDDGVCTITVGGSPQSNDATDGYGIWKANARFSYTANTGKSYAYTFKAWTASGNRTVKFQYYTNNDDSVFLNTLITITDTKKNYTVEGQKITNNVILQPEYVEFQCADQLGTFYVKMFGIVEIKDSLPRALVIQNIPANVYAYGADGGDIGIFTAGTTPEQALASTGLVAGADLTNPDIITVGNGPFTLTIPLYNISSTNRWTGSGTFDIYVQLRSGSGVHYYKAGSVNIGSATTTIPFSSATEVTP